MTAIRYCTISAAVTGDADAFDRACRFVRAAKGGRTQLLPCSHKPPGCHDPNQDELLALEAQVQKRTRLSLCGALGIDITP